MLRHSEIEGYQPVSRIGEVVINSFGTNCRFRTKIPSHHKTVNAATDRRVSACAVDSYEYAQLPEQLTAKEIDPMPIAKLKADAVKKCKVASSVGGTNKFTDAAAVDTFFGNPIDLARLNGGNLRAISAEAKAAVTAYVNTLGPGDATVEYKPHFHEWATALPSMICLSRKARNATFRNYVAAETATPVISCAACLKPDDAKNFYFAGVCRSKSVRPLDDGVGPQVDEYFTLAIGGMVTLLNNSKDAVFPGDMLEWCLYNESGMNSGMPAKRQKVGPRRVGVKVASPTSERVIGRCADPLAFEHAKPTRRTRPHTHRHCLLTPHTLRL